MTRFTVRRFDRNTASLLASRGIPGPLARALAARQINNPDQLDYDLKELLPPHSLLNSDKAGEIIADAIWNQKNITIVGDYDCDGATSVAVGILGLHLLGAQNVNYIIPDRDKDGYGLSVALVERAYANKTQLIITVDNGISSIDAVQKANELGIQTVITDHHLPGSALPQASCIVNPNQPEDTFPSKFLAGVGVMFYVLLSTRASMRKRNIFSPKTQPNLLNLIDLVALGTIADVVPLDRNNRILIYKGLERIRQGKLQPGLSALLRLAGKNSHNLTATDLAFVIAPRINASGRLANISTGVECLSSYEISTANALAQELEDFNQSRKELESSMQSEAILQLSSIELDETNSVALLQDSWHPGIVGLIASRIKERCYRPVIAFAPSSEDSERCLIKGSGRSIQGVHLRDALAFVDKNNPGLIIKFGGHALAAGLTIEKKNFDKFKEQFEVAVNTLALPGSFQKTLATDGELVAGEFSVHLAKAIKEQIWGAGFPAPIFTNHFKVISQKILKDQHLKLSLETDGRQLSAIWFRRRQPLPEYVRLAYHLDLNEWKGNTFVQLIIEAMEDESEDWGA